MERNRVLWVIFSISLFLVVVLAAGLYFLRPRISEGAAAAAREAPGAGSFDAFEYVRGRQGLPDLDPQSQRAEEMVIVVGEPDQPGSPTSAGPSAGIPVAREIVPAPAAPPPSARATGSVAPVERPRDQTTPRPAPKPAPKPAPRPAPKPAQVAEYWIQVGSFSSRHHADELGRSLTEKGLAPKTTTRFLNGATHYRVRLGPYANNAEARKFLEWVQALDGMERSYISMVTVRRTQP